MESAKPEIAEGVAYGSQLLEDDLIDEENKADIKRDIQNMDRNLAKLEEANDDEQNR